MTATDIYGELWDDLFQSMAIEDRYANAGVSWSRHGHACLEGVADLAAFLLNQAAASEPAGPLRPEPPRLEVLAKLGDTAHHQEVGSAVWNHLVGRLTSGQMHVVDPALEREFAELVKYGADSVFWFVVWGYTALTAMARRLSDEEFDRRLGSVLEEFDIE